MPTKEPMSVSYKAIFILAIVMMFVVLLVSVDSGRKTASVGVLYWGYTAWLMFRRNNDALVTLQKTVFSILAILLVVLGVWSMFLEQDSTTWRYLSVTPIAMVINSLVALATTFLLYKYFSHQTKSQDNPEPNSILVKENNKEGNGVPWLIVFGCVGAVVILLSTVKFPINEPSAVVEGKDVLTAQSKERSDKPITEPSGLCYVYWDKNKFQLGKTEGKEFVRYQISHYGVPAVTFAIPRAMAEYLGANAKSGDDINTPKFNDWFKANWHQVESLCGFKG